MRSFCLFILLFLMLPHELLAGETVTARGSCFFEEGKEFFAREKAIDEARRAALQQVLGAYINSMTIVTDFQLHEDRIISHSSGYVKNVIVIDEKKSCLGIMEVTIQAEVESADIKNDMQRFKEILSWQRNPRISIFILPATAEKNLPAATKAVGLLTSKLQHSGFTVLKFCDESQKKASLLVGITLEQSTKISHYQGMAISLNEIGFTADVFRPGDRDVLASSCAVRSIPGENTFSVLDKGCRQCIDVVWKDLKTQLLRQYEKELYNERNIYFTLKNVGLRSRALEVSEALTIFVPGVADCSILTYDGKKAEYNLRYRGRPEHLANELEMSYFRNKGFKSELESLSENSIVLLMQK